MTKVMTVRDFTQIFDAYSQFEESLITNLMNEANTEGIDDDGNILEYSLEILLLYDVLSQL